MRKRRWKDNEIQIRGDVAYLFLYDQKGRKKAEALIDPADIPLVKGYRWVTHEKGYVVTFPDLDNKSIYLHHVINGTPPKGHMTDHRNRNPLDNRRQNLRIATRGLNRINSKVSRNSKTGLKNISLVNGKYRVRVTIMGKLHNIGTFGTTEEAILHRDRALISMRRPL